MKSLIKFLLSGFGTDTMAGKAVGITILVFLAAFLIAWYIISGIVKLITKSRKPANPVD